MNKNKIIFIVLVCFIFFIFSICQYKRSKCYEVLNIKSPFEIVIDLNKNGVEDDDETISILDGYQYISRAQVSEGGLEDKYNLSKSELSALAYLTERFANDNLKDKTVTIKTRGEEKVIYQGVNNFNEALLNSGFVFKDYKPVKESALSNIMDYIHKTPLVLYNAKSNKYHKLDCKYGLIAHNYVCISRSQLPKGANGCKFCFSEKKTEKHFKNKQQKIVKPVPILLTSGSIKVLIADYTRKQKHDKNINTNICNELVNLINNTQSSIDMAIYGCDRIPKVENAIKNAIARGVVVRIVYDANIKGQNIYEETMYLVNLIKNSMNDNQAFYPEQKTLYANSIMHNKFYIFDESIVMTGSANLSYTDMSGFNCNNVVIIHSKDVAKIYKKEFEQMYNGKFHCLKSQIPNKPVLQIGNSKVSIYFSPADSVIEKIVVPLINNAKSYIYIPAFLVTDKRFAQALINAKNRGVEIKVIIDAANARSPYSKHRLFRQHGIKVKTENFAGKLHSKTIIIDNKYSIMGSMNFSKNGERINDENVLVIEDSKIATFNKVFFEYLWNKISDYWLNHDANAEGLDSPGSCSDGIDNDYDGKIDLDDEGCHIHQGKQVK